MKMNVILEKAEHNWCAYTPDEGFCIIATGPSRDKVIERFQGALKQQIEVLRDEGRDIPDITELDVREIVPVDASRAA